MSDSLFDFDNVKGVDINDLLRKGAKAVLKAQKEARERPPEPVTEQRDTICVVQTVLDSQPTYLWQPQGTLPFDIPYFEVRASLAEAVRNKQSLQQLLERRLRRGYRDRLLAKEVMPEAQALARVMKLQVSVVEL